MKMEIIDFAWKREIIDYVVEQIIDFIVKRSKHETLIFTNSLPSGWICD
jgi:hypothetical protein